MSTPPAGHPYVVAVIGAGPSGIYAAEALTQQSDVPVQVAVIDKLPVPFGLVRYGVAPDHPSIRSIRSTLERTLARPEVRFFGDVAIGRDLTVAELRERVDAVVYAWGAGTGRRLEIPGEDAIGSLAAPEFVSWYTGHPDIHPDPGTAAPHAGLDHAAMVAMLERTRTAVVVGAGNVALDVVRMLVPDPAELAGTDMADEVLAVLARTQVRDVHLLARRGPAQTQMTTKELRELGRIDDCDIYVYPPDLDWDAEAAAEITKVAQRNLVEFATWAQGERQLGASRRIHLHFWTRPEAIATADGRVRGVDTVGTRPEDARAEHLEAELVVRAIGYRGVPLDGVAFDADTGRVPHDAGRVMFPQPGGRQPVFATGEYVTGWIKRGPTGVIGTNKSDAVETVQSLLHDIAQGDLLATHPGGLGELESLLAERGIDPVELPDWRLIDAAEIEHGHAQGRDRATLAHRADLMRAAGREDGVPHEG